MKLLTGCIIINVLILYSLSPCVAQTPVFYGMANEGGTHNAGVIIKFDPATDKENVVWDFGSGSDGVNAYGNLVYNSNNGLFYGMTVQGGKAAAGTIIAFNPLTGNEGVVWNLGKPLDGQFPWADLVYDATNKLFYGMTDMGGTHNGGTIFRFDAADSTESVVWNLGSGSDGKYSVGNLVYDPDNNLFYAMTAYGGSNGKGAIISLDPATNSESLVWSLGAGTDGAAPYGSFIYNAANGTLYGMTNEGGTNNVGAIISYNPGTNTESVVWSFGGALDGYNPQGNLIYDATHSLFYGMTFYGGSHSVGTIFSFDPNTDAENIVWNFGNKTDGTHPYGSLVYNANDGLYYGMTYDGGTAGDGTIIYFNSANNTDSVLWNFRSTNDTDGYFPMGSLVIYSPTSGINAIHVSSSSATIYPNPNNGNFAIQLHNVKQNTLIEIFNVLGEKIYTANLNSINTQITLNNHIAGIYLYRVLDGQGNQIGDGKLVIE